MRGDLIKGFRASRSTSEQVRVGEAGVVDDDVGTRDGVCFTDVDALALSGTATRPVPTANSSAGPPRANSARRSTVGSRTDGSNIAE
jgi:hypothetical protein